MATITSIVSNAFANLGPLTVDGTIKSWQFDTEGVSKAVIQFSSADGEPFKISSDPTMVKFTRVPTDSYINLPVTNGTTYYLTQDAIGTDVQAATVG